METAGGFYVPPVSPFCYCKVGPSGYSRCGCSEFELFPLWTTVPVNVASIPSAGTYGRIGVDKSQACPFGTSRRQGDSNDECLVAPGSFVYPRAPQGALSFGVDYALSLDALAPPRRYHGA
jgi:hypothetical protein